MGPVLVLEVEATGEQRRHHSGWLRIGRAVDNDLVLPDPGPQRSLSRKHCVIEATGHGFTVTDLGSTNGTRLNGREVPPNTPMPLASGDRLELGRQALRVTVEEEPAPLPQPTATLPPSRPAASPRPAPSPSAAPAGSLDELLGGLAMGEPEPSAAAAPPPLSPQNDPLGGFSDELQRLFAMPPRRDKGTTPGDHVQPQLEAFTIAPSQPAPTPPPPPVAEGSAVLRAFLEGAGLDPKDLTGEPAELMREAGRAFAAMAAGLRDLLATRALVKDHAGVTRTVIGAVGNNPLKYSAGQAELVRALLVRRDVSYLPPLPAIEAAFDDLKAHELALLEGVQAAVQGLLNQFDPTQLEAKLAEISSLGLLLQGGRRAQLWELYTERYAEIAKSARMRFMGDVDRAFATAYERKVREIGNARQLEKHQ